jgi:hypothetical protein
MNVLQRDEAAYYEYPGGFKLLINYRERFIWAMGLEVSDINQIYCAISDKFDEVAQIDEEFPVRAIDRWTYEMINDWQLRIGDYVFGGEIAIKMSPEELEARL